MELDDDFESWTWIFSFVSAQITMRKRNTTEKKDTHTQNYIPNVERERKKKECERIFNGSWRWKFKYYDCYMYSAAAAVDIAVAFTTSPPLLSLAYAKQITHSDV